MKLKFTLPLTRFDVVRNYKLLLQITTGTLS